MGVTSPRKAALGFILFTVFLDVLGIGLVIPVLPTLVGEFTTTPQYQSYWYGALAAAYGVMQFCCSPLLGALSDRYGRRPVLLLSIFGLGMNYLLTALAPSLGILMLARLVGGATGASFSVASAYVADVTPPADRSKGLGLIGAAFGMGFICGPILGGILGGFDLRWPFYAACALSVINWFYGLLVLPESHPPGNRGPLDLARANPFRALANLAALEGVGGLVTVFAVTVLAQIILQSTWVLFTTFRFGWGPVQNGVILFLVGLNTAVVQGRLLSTLLKRLGEKTVVLLGLGSGTLAYLLYGLVREPWLMYAVVFANILGYASGPALQGIISKAADPARQGITMGSLNAINSVMFVVAPLIGTALFAQVGHLSALDWRVGITFFVSAALQLLALELARRHFRAP